ncbi:nitroreductase [uncultured Jannaschia sp.]|uniref:nitroreductase family protein n=1 Tax=uncultured Jannaschia sp. TaxID=293347 RepID=UPI0026325ECD|nr:nitroreductase [uncultured Jannaschia sp.]
MTHSIPPLAPNAEAAAFLAARRSRPAKTLAEPAPDRAALSAILETALRVPDHGKLEPWRLVVLSGAALDRLAALTERLGRARGLDPERTAKARAMFDAAPCMVGVISDPVPSEKIPQVEQILSAGALCHNLVCAAQAAGWGANWLSGWMATDPDFLRDGFDIEPPAFLAGLVVLGTETVVPPE